MAEEKPDSGNSGTEPPKIQIGNVPKQAKPATGPIPVGRPAVTPSKVNLARAGLPQGGVPAPAKPESKPDSKKITARVNLAKAQTTQIKPLTEQDKLEAAKKSTVRVQIEDVIKGDTQQLKGAAMPSQIPDARHKTAQINLADLGLNQDQDILKKQTMAVDPSKFAGTTAAGIPRTIRIKEGPPTATLKKPPETGAVSLTPAAGIEQAKKSETARIDLPVSAETEEIPPTRRKTIRIKRPEGGVTLGGRQLVINQAASESAEEAVTEKVADDEPGPLFFVAALLAAMVTIGILVVQVLTLRSFGQY